MSDVKNLEKLITSRHNCISIVTAEEQYALEVIRNVAMKLSRDLWLWSAGTGVRDGLLQQSPAIAETGQPYSGLCNLAAVDDGAICITLDLAEHIRAGNALRALRDLINDFAQDSRILIMIDREDNLPGVIKSYAHPFELSLPDEKEIEQIARDTVKEFHKDSPITIEIGKKGFNAIIKNLLGLTRRQARQVVIDAIALDRKLCEDDINKVISNKRRIVQSSGLLEYIETPLELDAIGGMNNLKKWLRDRKNAFSEDAGEFGLTSPRGLLMLGVQGAGKSLCAKAVSTAWRQPLLRLDPGSLYASYVGQSEQNLRQSLHQAEMMAPVILWIDEIEKAFASAASHSTDGGLSQRMFGTLLTWLQEHPPGVFVIATANDIEALPPELLRKGRFDEIFFVGLPKSDARKQIFKIHLRKRKRNPADYDLNKLVKQSEGYSGAEIEQVVMAALHEAYAQKQQVTTEHILDALRNSPPLSVTMREKIQSLIQWSKGRCVPAD